MFTQDDREKQFQFYFYTRQQQETASLRLPRSRQPCPPSFPSMPDLADPADCATDPCPRNKHAPLKHARLKHQTRGTVSSSMGRGLGCSPKPAASWLGSGVGRVAFFVVSHDVLPSVRWHRSQEARAASGLPRGIPYLPTSTLVPGMCSKTSTGRLGGAACRSGPFLAYGLVSCSRVWCHVSRCRARGRPEDKSRLPCRQSLPSRVV